MEVDKSETRKKENQENQCIRNKTQAILECESIIECKTTCIDILKCMHKPVVAPKVKKERGLLKGVTEYFIFWN